MRSVLVVVFSILLLATSSWVVMAEEVAEQDQQAQAQQLTKKELKAQKRAERKAKRDAKRAARDSAVRCQRRGRTGSHFRQTRCATNAQIREEREAARKMLEEGQGGPIGSRGDGL